MQIINLKLSEIKPDPNQPRKSFNKDKIEELAATFKTVGVINPIEVDKHHMIITGENRWRAAKVAGLTTIPAKVLEVTPEERFLRQVIENIQYANLTPIETANALQKLLTKLAVSFDRDPKHSGSRYQKGYKELGKLLGKDADWVRIHLLLLEESKPLQKAIEKGLPLTHLEGLHRIPVEHRGRVEQQLLQGKIKNRDVTRYIADALKRAPDKAEEILSVDYSKYRLAQEAAEAIAKIAPRLSDQLAASTTPTDELNQISISLRNWCAHNPPDTIGRFYYGQVLVTMKAIIQDVETWRTPQINS